MDALFRLVADHQGPAPWGSVLDAGTGEHSLRWIASLPTSSWCAVTASPAAAAELRARAVLRHRPQDRILIGDWTDPGLLAGETFDVVVADYLLGSISGHAPFFQERLFPRLRRVAGGRLYAIGLEPVPPRSDDAGGELVCEVVRLRDACIRLAGHRTYDEYPLDWVLQALPRAGFRVERSWSVPIAWRLPAIRRQLEVARRKLPLFQDERLAAALGGSLAGLEDRAAAWLGHQGAIHFGSDWVVAAVAA